MFKTIITYEFKYFLRNKILAVSILVLLLISGYALYNGNSFCKKQIAVIDKLKVKDSLSYQTIIENFNSDTLTDDGKWKYRNVTQATWAIFDNRFNVYWKPNFASAISIGNRDVYPYYQEIMPVSLYMRLFKNEISNPNTLLIGNIDLSYIIIFIFPLFIIALLFNFSSDNREKGIEPFLYTNTSALKNINFARLTFYTLTILSILLLLFALTFTVFVKENIGVVLLKLFLLSALFSVFWIGVCYLVNRLKRSSVFNISFLIAIWLILSLLIPSVANQVAAYKYPINTEEISKNIRRVQLKDDKQEFVSVLKNFYTKYPHYYNADTSTTTLFSLAYLAQGQLSDLEGDSLLNGICDKMLQKQQFLKTIAWINPTMYLQNSFANKTETNLSDYVRYLKRLQQFNKEIKLFYFKKAFTDDKMDLNYYQSVPKWK